MPSHVDQVLDQRRRRLTAGQRRRYLAASVAGHVAGSLLFLALPALLAEPPQTFDSIAVTVVPPKALGDPNPPPPPPPKEDPAPVPEPEPAPPPPPPPPPKPDPKPKPQTQPPPSAPPQPKPETKPAPPPPAPETRPAPPARRVGSVFGNPLGASTSAATIGVEDPNFTYGYYLDLVVQRISENWQPPRVDTDSRDAVVYFRIQRNGTVTELQVKESSRSSVFDRRALAAVEVSVPLPPLPKGYDKDFLGINLIVKNPFAKGQT